MKTRLFISHQWRDKQIADRLARDLEPFADVWMDYRNLRPGDAIQPTIDRALQDIDLVLVVWTQHASRSTGVAAEIQKSRELGLRVVPCFFEYDGGCAHPPLPAELASTLGVDFHHHGSGVAQLAEFIVEMQRRQLPKEAALDEHPAVRLLTYLRGYLSYLANYRSVQNVTDDRAEWVDKIITEVERFVASGGSRDAVRTLLEAARGSSVDDEEGIGMLISRLERLLHDEPPATTLSGSPAQPTVAKEDSGTSPTRRPPPRDELVKRITLVVPGGTEDTALRQVESYIGAAPAALQALAAYVKTAQSPAGAQVVQYLHTYLESGDDIIPDHHGRFGLVDDAWLILNTAFRLIESRLLPAAAVPLDWPSIIGADYVVRSILPPQALEALTSIMLQLLQIIATEVATYQPWFTPDGNGYAPTMAPPRWSGGTWEDQMNSALLGTGLSVDG
jgi:hypothetical protein